jgi:colanic acid/amylovoran biosynthesis glycosyltransferase
MRRVGILIPEFPGQTHSFFWRELARLKDHGVEGVLISTRKPPPGLVCHAWTQEAAARTHYLVPPSLDLGVAAIRVLTKSFLQLPACVRAIAKAEGLDARGRARLSSLAAVGAQLVALSQREGFSHVHVHSAADAAHVALFAHLLGGVSYSLTLHGPLSDYGPNQQAKWANAAFGIVITKKLQLEMREELGASLPPKLVVAPMGVQVDRYIRTSPYVPWGGSGCLRVFSCGRLNPVKGHLELAEAVAALNARGMDVQLRVAGEDDAGGAGYRLILERELKARGLEPYVKLLGAIADGEVKRELEEAHIFALASHHEPLGVAIMEAMALSLPVVVTSAGGVTELVDDGVDGLLVPPREPSKMAERISEVAASPGLARELGQKARLKIESQFDSGISARHIAELSQR